MAKNGFFLVFQEGGWVQGLLMTEFEEIAAAYHRCGKDATIVPDQPNLLLVRDTFSCAVPFLFKHVLGEKDFVFLDAIPDESRGGTLIGHVAITPQGMRPVNFEHERRKELAYLNSPSKYISDLLEENHLVLKKYEIL